MLLPRVAGAGASAAAMSVAIGASTGPASTTVVVVVVVVLGGIAETKAAGAAAPTHSAAPLTSSATTPTLDLTVSRLVGWSRVRRGGQSHGRQQCVSGRQAEPGDAARLGQIG